MPGHYLTLYLRSSQHAVKILVRSLLILIVLLLGFGIYFYFAIKTKEPELSASTFPSRTFVGDSLYFVGNNWLKKNKYGLYEMYVEGTDFERGYVNGLLSKELVVRQEEIFVGKLNDMLPGKGYQTFLLAVVGWINRNLDQRIDEEYLHEIYGVSRSASDDFDYIAPKYQRILNYHAAHDIGHAMQNMNLVACTSVGLWGSRTADSSLLIGRNFDFYMGEEFAKDKIVLFVSPDSGYRFASITWGGFVGVVSGMNEKGLTVTLNAAKTGIPGSAKTPVSIIGRKILQYASNIQEAYAIAKQYDSFVAESFMVGSKQDGKVAIIEKTPEATTLYFAAGNTITCSNHFQGQEWTSDSLNVQNLRDSPTGQRQERLVELIQPTTHISPPYLALILRNRLGPNNQDLGMGNEKALNQFVAHHSVIFQPETGRIWVSAFPYQLGAYVAYDLNEVFAKRKGLKQNLDITLSAATIPADSFLYSQGYQQLLYSKAMTEKIRKMVWNEEGQLSAQEIKQYIASNPHYFHTYFMLGDYYKMKQLYDAAIKSYQKAMELDIPREPEKKAIEERIEECKKKKS